MQYSIYNHIRVFYKEADGISTKPPENTSGIAQRMEATLETKTKMQEFGIKLIDAVLSVPKRSEALKIFNLWNNALEFQFGKPLPNAWKNIMQSILGQLEYSQELFDSTGRSNMDKISSKTKLMKILNNALSEIQASKPVGSSENSKSKLSEAEQKKVDFIKKYGEVGVVAKYWTNDALAHPRVSPTKLKELMDTIKKEPESPEKEKYLAVLETIYTALGTRVFQSNAGMGIEGGIWDRKKALERKDIFAGAFREIVTTAIKTGKSQSIEGFGNEDFKKISLDEEVRLNNFPPDKLFDIFVTNIKGRRLTEKEQFHDYINVLSGIVNPILAKLSPDNPLQKQYENKFTQMRALAENPILHDGWATFAGAFTGNTIDKFLGEVESAKGKEGSIGYDENGDFKFYTIEAMKEDIMKDGQIEGTVDVAWDSYIKGTGSDISKLTKVFGEDGLNALSLYIEAYPDSSIANGDSMRVFVANLKQKRTESMKNDAYEFGEGAAKAGKTVEFTKKIKIQTDFPNLHMLSIDINRDIQIPREGDDTINAITLTYALLKEKKPGTPEDYRQVLEAIKKDFALKENLWKEKKEKTTESLTSRGYTGWADIGNKFGLGKINYTRKDGKPANVVLDSDFNQSLSPDERKAIIAVLQKKQNTNPEKKEDIDVILEFLHAKHKEKEAKVAQVAADTASPVDMSKSQDDLIAKNAIAQAAHTAARSSVEKIENQESLQKKAPQILEFLQQHGIVVQDVSELAHPRYRNTVNNLIRELETGGRDEDRAILTGLKQIRYQTELDAEAVHSAYELAQTYPEYGETVNRIKQSNATIRDAIDHPESGVLAAYLYIDSPQSYSAIEQGIMSTQIGGGAQKIGDIISSTPGAGNLSDLSDFTKNASVQRTSQLECEVNFGTSPTSRQLGSVSNIPIRSFDAFIAQSELYGQLGLHALIPLIPDINKSISKKTGKKTDFADGKFDIQEMRRTLHTLSASMLGIETTGQESIEELKVKIASKYPAGQKEIESKLINIGVLRREGGYRTQGLQRAI